VPRDETWFGSGSSRFVERRQNVETQERDEIDFSEWTACEVHGHRFNIDSERFDSCVDCDEPRETDD